MTADVFMYCDFKESGKMKQKKEKNATVHVMGAQNLSN
jgi:hypothetical protein